MSKLVLSFIAMVPLALGATVAAADVNPNVIDRVEMAAGMNGLESPVFDLMDDGMSAGEAFAAVYPASEDNCLTVGTNGFMLSSPQICAGDE